MKNTRPMVGTRFSPEIRPRYYSFPFLYIRNYWIALGFG